MMYTMEVHRTQILLEDRQYSALKAWSRKSGKGLGELVRQAIDRFLGQSPPASGGSKLSSIRGLAIDPKGPSGRDHDQVLYGKGK
jgi:hypothetical protein